MPPIPVHTHSPINPAKAAPPTPQTSTSSDSSLPSIPPPTTTAALPATTTLPSSGPPQPQPGAVPHLPAPTSSSPLSGPAPPAPAVTAAPTYPPPPTQTAIPPPHEPYNQRGTSTAFTPATTTARAVLPGAGSSPYGNYPDPAPSSGARGPGEDEGVLSSAMKFAKAAGEKLSAAESEVWRRINGEKN
ncbi:hypothetical protein QBC42DRAFT_351128 [Cladorrhinum samala]|uniref:Uncharacterized protein n=1 Tax=Cladorrhinum samala TaxID=585594 RepID=A0AAV9H7G2_9PEZI|nr:hypothetical protein QBC42DRAFT_351128 [Cladorrhinum samala]